MIKKSSNRVNRGGSWNNQASNCRSANRNRNDPSNRNNNLGFRLLLNSAGMDDYPSITDGTDHVPGLSEVCHCQVEIKQWIALS